MTTHARTQRYKVSLTYWAVPEHSLLDVLPVGQLAVALLPRAAVQRHRRRTPAARLVQERVRHLQRVGHTTGGWGQSTRLDLWRSVCMTSTGTQLAHGSLGLPRNTSCRATNTGTQSTSTPTALIGRSAPAPLPFNPTPANASHTILHYASLRPPGSPDVTPLGFTTATYPR